MAFTIEKVANMVFITSDCGVVFKAWNIEDFTEKKLANAVKRINKDLNDSAKFERMF